MIGGVVINVYIIIVQGKTVRPRTTIIGVEDNEVDYLFRHLAFGVGVARWYLAQALSAIKRLRTRSAAVRHWRDFGLKRLRTRSCHE